jgi:hypothetical protein
MSGNDPTDVNAIWTSLMGLSSTARNAATAETPKEMEMGAPKSKRQIKVENNTSTIEVST